MIKALIPILLVLALALPAEAKFRPVTFLKHTVSLGVGVATAPLMVPFVEIDKRIEYYRLMHRGAGRAAMEVNGWTYDWFWIEQWW